MLEDGVAERIRTLLRSDMPPVQFKLLGTLRMMVDGQGNDKKTALMWIVRSQIKETSLHKHIKLTCMQSCFRYGSSFLPLNKKKRLLWLFISLFRLFSQNWTEYASFEGGGGTDMFSELRVNILQFNYISLVILRKKSQNCEFISRNSDFISQNCKFIYQNYDLFNSQLRVCITQLWEKKSELWDKKSK